MTFIARDLAEAIHDAGLTADTLANRYLNDQLIVITPRLESRAVIIPPNQIAHVMVLMNDLLGDYLWGDRWQTVLDELRVLEDVPSERLDMPAPEQG